MQECQWLYFDKNNQTQASSGSIGLGGVETTDGRHGFIGSYHVTAESINNPVYREIKTNGNKEQLLGTVTRDTVLNTKTTDSMFMQYPVGCSAVDQQQNLCAPTAKYVPIVEPMKIYRGSNTAYTVTGEATLNASNTVTWVGATHGVKTGTYTTKIMTITLNELSINLSTIVASSSSGESANGDSGGPVFVADSSHNAKFAGIIVGHNTATNIHETYFSLWSNIKDDLGLKPLS